MSMSNSRPKEFTITRHLNQILEYFPGNKISEQIIEDINKGVIDILIGYLLTQTFNNESEIDAITIRTIHCGDFVLSNNESLKLNPEIFNLLGNAALINKPREIFIDNINIFSKQLRDSLNYGHKLAIIYNQIEGKIIYFNLVGDPSTGAPLPEEIQKKIEEERNDL